MTWTEYLSAWASHPNNFEEFDALLDLDDNAGMHRYYWHRCVGEMVWLHMGE